MSAVSRVRSSSDRLRGARSKHSSGSPRSRLQAGCDRCARVFEGDGVAGCRGRVRWPTSGQYDSIGGGSGDDVRWVTVRGSAGPLRGSPGRGSRPTISAGPARGRPRRGRSGEAVASPVPANSGTGFGFVVRIIALVCWVPRIRPSHEFVSQLPDRPQFVSIAVTASSQLVVPAPF